MEQEKLDIPIKEISSERSIKVRVVGGKALDIFRPSFNEEYFSQKVKDAQPETEQKIDDIIREEAA
jgi:hypothetical protein